MTIAKTVSLLLVLLCLPFVLFAQTTGEYRTGVVWGKWSAAGTWEMYNGITWAVAGSAPNGSETISIKATDSVEIDVAVTISGTLKTLGGKTVTTTGSMTFSGTYEHAMNGGSIPVATWLEGSTCLVTGVTANAPSNANQNFYNLTWNCPSQTANLNLGWQNARVNLAGTLTCISTGFTHASYTSPTGTLRLFGGSGACQINNILVNGYNAYLTPMGSSGYLDTVTVPGNITITANGMFSMSNNSSANGTIYLKGNLAIVDSGAIGKSNSGNPSKLIFCGTGVQTYSGPAGGGPLLFQSAPNFEVSAGSTLLLAENKDTLAGAGSFRLMPGATLSVGNTAGINGSIRCSGSNGGGNIFSKAGNYIFAGSSAQVTGTAMPDTVANLTINNASGVTLSDTTAVNGVLTLTAGVLDNTNPVRLGPSGTVSYGSGSLLFPLTGVESEQTGIPAVFAVGQNYPNPFNPSTTITYALPKSSMVSVRIFNLLGQEVKSLFHGMQSAGIHRLTFEPAGLTSGAYLYRVQAGMDVQVRRMMFVK